MAPLRALVAAAVLTAAASACSDDSADQSSAAPPTIPSSSAPDEGPTTVSSSTAPSSSTTVPDPDGPPCTDAAPPPSGEELGWADVDGDGRGELWVRTGAGASTLLVGLYRYDSSCEPRRVRLDGAPAELPIGGSITHVGGARCTGADRSDLHVFSGTSTDGQTYEMTTRFLALDGAELVEVDGGTAPVDASDVGFPRYATFACGDLRI